MMVIVEYGRSNHLSPCPPDDLVEDFVFVFKSRPEKQTWSIREVSAFLDEKEGTKNEDTAIVGRLIEKLNEKLKDN